MSEPNPVARRRTFAIISHPDAGKTTLTEKMLLFGGAIQLAGEVRAKANRRKTRSDWMGIERERGDKRRCADGDCGSLIHSRPPKLDK